MAFEISKESTFIQACAAGNAKIMSELLSKSPIDLIKIPASNGSYPLMFVAESGSFEALNLLLEKGAEINATPVAGVNKGLTALLFAANARQWAFVGRLLDAGARSLNATPETGPGSGITTLWLAANWQKWPLVERLLNLGAKSLDTTPVEGPNRGKTALWYAARWQQWFLVERLLDLGARNLNAFPTEGENLGVTVILFAAHHKQWRLVDRLLSLGAENKHLDATTGKDLLNTFKIEIKLDLLEKNTSEPLFDFSYCRFSRSQMDKLCKSLENNKSVKELRFGHTYIDGSDGLALGKALMLNRILTSIDLEYCSLGLEGMKAIAEAIKLNRTLFSINLRSNSSVYGGWGGKVIDVLAEALKVNSTLTSIDLGRESNLIFSSIGPKIGNVIADVLRVNRTLSSIKLDGHDIGPAAGKDIAEALKTNVTLTTINLCNNKLWTVGIKALAESLEVNRNLTSINLANNNWEDEGGMAIIKALKVNKTLTDVDIRCFYKYEMGPKADEILSEIDDLLVKRNPTALLIGTHPRLGADSSVLTFTNNPLYDKNLFSLIFQMLGYTKKRLVGGPTDGANSTTVHSEASKNTKDTAELIKELERQRLELEARIKQLRAETATCSPIRPFAATTASNLPEVSLSSSSSASIPTPTPTRASLSTLSADLINLVGAGLDTPDIAHLRKQGRIFRTTCKPEMLERRRVTKDLLPHVFNTDPKKIKAFFAEPGIPTKMVLTKTSYREGYISKDLKQFVCFRRWRSVSPLQAAALSLDNFLVRDLLSHIERDEALRLKAAQQLQEVLNRKEMLAKAKGESVSSAPATSIAFLPSGTGAKGKVENKEKAETEVEADLEIYQAPFRALLKAYNDYFNKYEILYAANDYDELNKLWARVEECHRRLPTYGQKYFDPPSSFTTSGRSYVLRACRERAASAAINGLCEFRQAELENIIKCLLKPGMTVTLSAQEGTVIKP